MATLTVKNPVLVAGPTPEVKKLLVANNQTWKAGQWGYSSSGLVTVCATDASSIRYILLEDLNTSSGTAGTTYANVGLITSDMVFEMNELDGSLDSANIGLSYGIDVTSNVVTVDEAEVTTKVLTCVDVASNYEPSRGIATDTKNKGRFRVIEAALSA